VKKIVRNSIDNSYFKRFSSDNEHSSIKAKNPKYFILQNGSIFSENKKVTNFNLIQKKDNISFNKIDKIKEEVRHIHNN